MKGYKDRFYERLRTDYEERQESSFLFRYMEKEKKKNFRLRLKEEYRNLEDTRESRRAYGAFIAGSLLEEDMLKKQYDKSDTLVAFIRQGLSLSDKEARAVCRRKDLTEDSLKRLKELLTEGERAASADFSAEFLEKLTAELLEKYQIPEKRRDLYVQVQECFLDWQMGNISQRDYLIAFCRTLAENDKLPFGIRKYRFGAEQRELLLECAEQIGCGHIFAGIKNNKKRYEKLLQVLEAKEDAGALLSEEQMERLNEELKKSILRLDVQTFLYDVGHPFKQEEGRVYKSRKKDRTMDMLDAYCGENFIFFGNQGPAGSKGPDELSEEEIKFYEKLRIFLNDTQNRNALFPIRIDSVTGASLYLLGSLYFPESLWGDPPAKRARHRKKEFCRFVCIYWNDVEIDEDSGWLNFCWDTRESSEGKKACCFPDLREAWVWYNSDVRETAHDLFKACNNVGEQPVWEAYLKGINGYDWEEFEKSISYDWKLLWSSHEKEIRGEMKALQAEEARELIDKRRKKGMPVW